jgi:hypothetical protein
MSLLDSPMFAPKPRPSRAQRIKKARNLLTFHKELAVALAHARRCGSAITAKYFKARLLVNAQALRGRILGA